LEGSYKTAEKEAGDDDWDDLPRLERDPYANIDPLNRKKEKEEAPKENLSFAEKLAQIPSKTWNGVKFVGDRSDKYLRDYLLRDTQKLPFANNYQYTEKQLARFRRPAPTGDKRDTEGFKEEGL